MDLMRPRGLRSIAALSAALAHLLSGALPAALTLPVGLPWIGAHFRLDALAAFFLVVVNLGGGVASLYALGYGRAEGSPAACCRSTLLSSPP